MAEQTKVVMPATPECNKMLAVKERSQEIGQFIAWITTERERPLVFAEWKGRRYDILSQVDVNIEQVLAEYFGIDLEAIENERRELLLYCRLQNEEGDQRKELAIEKKEPPTVRSLARVLQDIIDRVGDKECHCQDDPKVGPCPFCKAKAQLAELPFS